MPRSRKPWKAPERDAGAESNTMKPSPVKPTIPLSMLDALDIRVGTIEAVEDLPTSRKLVRLIVNSGDRRGTTLAGMKGERPDPREILRRQALFVVTLEPGK